jgi:hypothetical protein
MQLVELDVQQELVVGGAVAVYRPPSPAQRSPLRCHLI